MTHAPLPKFKQTFVDFVVEEHLPYPLAKHGTWFYVQLEKRNMNTMDMVKKIMKAFWLTRKKIGIAGLKDKHALATQRVCFHSNDIKKIGEKKFLETISTIAKPVTTGYSQTPLGLHSAITNQFWIRLKNEWKVSQEKKTKREEKFASLVQDWFPNYFWEQRFGVTANNHRVAQDILEWWRKHFTQSEKKFKLQGYASWLFNKYIDHRLKIYGWIDLLEWDLVIDPNDKNQFLLFQWNSTYSTIEERKGKWFFVPAVAWNQSIQLNETVSKWAITGPLLGYNTLLSPKESVSGKYEQGWIKHFELTEDNLHLYKPYELYGLRRPLWVFPQEYSLKRQWNDLLLQFTLPKSAYASVVIDLMLEE